MYLVEKHLCLEGEMDRVLPERCAIFWNIIGDLGHVGVKVDGEDQAMILLLRDFVNRTYVWKETISLEMVSSMLLSHNKRRQHTSGDKYHSNGLYTSNNQEGKDRRRSKQIARTSRDLSQRPRRKQSALVVEKQATLSEIAQKENSTMRRILKGSSKSANVVQNDNLKIAIQIHGFWVELETWVLFDWETIRHVVSWALDR
ncbi:hypothetical protein V2J09_010920 [Rumex salicifolius]